MRQFTKAEYLNINPIQHDFFSKYFNYIKDSLQETKEGSLYFELTNNNLNMSIKSISCDIDIILKSKILFSIKIELNSKSYYFIIIEIKFFQFRTPLFIIYFFYIIIIFPTIITI